MEQVDIDKQMEGLTFASDEEKAGFRKILEANSETFSRRYLRREEGSRLAQAKTDAERKAQQLEQDIAREKQISNDHLAAIEDWKREQLEAAQLEAVENFKTQLKAKGIDPDSALGLSLQQQQIPQPVAPKPEDLEKQFRGKFLDIDTARSLAQVSMDLPLKMPVIMDRYRALYGDTPADWSGFQARAKDGLMKGVDVDATAEEFFKFSEKQKEKETADLRKQIETEMETQFQERLAKMQIPGAQGQVNIAADDPLFSAEFAAKATDSEQSKDADARNDFMAVHAQLEQAGVSMLK